MVHIIIDRRKNDRGKSSVNRQRYVQRIREQVKDAVKKIIADGSVKEIVDAKGKKIKVTGKDLIQPDFHHAKGGIVDRVLPGNKQFQQGDRFQKEKEGGGQGGKSGSKDGEGEDSFEFHLTYDEFLDMFFEDLELPDMLKKSIAKVDEFVFKRSGFSTDGTPSRLNILRSMKQARGRRIALRSPKRRKLKELELELMELEKEIEQRLSEGLDVSIERGKRVELEEEIRILRRQHKAIPFIDDVDLRYNRWEKTPIPSTQAVMFGIMDVSGSMGEWEKEMAKRFFMLMLLFLSKNYEKVDIVWIRHHTSPKEVDEEEFFHSKESGGTLVSPALDLMDDILAKRYPVDKWNIFGVQISDGDNWTEDNEHAHNSMEKLLPKTQYFAYVELDEQGNSSSDLWPVYAGLMPSNPNFVMSIISHVSEIYPVFRKLFEKRK